METIEQSVEVDAPLSTVYNQWTQFEEFPEFMEGIEEVRQLDDQRLHWVGNVAGHRHEWDAEITEQIPDQRIAWRSASGKRNDGQVEFERLSDTRTRVKACIHFEPDGAMEKMGTTLGIASARVKGNLKRFKEFIEARGQESGAWRGEIRGGQTIPGASTTPRSKRPLRRAIRLYQRQRNFRQRHGQSIVRACQQMSRLAMGRLSRGNLLSANAHSVSFVHASLKPFSNSPNAASVLVRVSSQASFPACFNSSSFFADASR